MPVPSSISDLSTTPALNSPPGSESPSSIDDYLRTHAAFIKQINDLKADASALASKADDSAVVKLTGAQTVAGTKTFSASPVVPDATAPKHPATKDQLDAKAPIASPAFTGVPTAPNPTAGTRSQALATMQMFADEFGASVGGSGWQKLPSGLIIQWGTSGAIASGGNATITLPVAMPSSIVAVVGSLASGGAKSGAYSFGAGALTTTNFRLQHYATNGGAGVYRWIAIGY